MNKALRHHARPALQRGFTLIELMIAVLLGLLSMLAVTQINIQAEARKRTVSQGSDAQVNGSLALFAIQRDVQMSGYGAIDLPDALGCTVTGQYDTGAAFTFPLAPVVIAAGVGSAPDTITVLQGHTQSVSVPSKVTELHPQTGAYVVVASSLGVQAGDLMIAVPKAQAAGTQCTLFAATNNAAAAATTLGVNRIPHTNAGSKWNQSAIFPAGGYAVDSYVLNMGAMVQRTYSISATQSLQTTERSPTDGSLSTPQDLYPQVVTMQALYGKDTGGDHVVDTYDKTTPANNAEWRQVMTVRVAVVARSGEYEKEVVTAAEPQWDVGATAVNGVATVDCNNGSKCINLKVNTLPDWHHYRYKVYETTIPLRNILWNS